MMDSKTPKIFVIILNYNGIETLPACLASVFQSDYPNFEVVIVDNDSKDESFEKACIAYSKAHFIKNSTNTGFSSGNNVGIRWALEKFADFILILNNDATLEKNTLSELIEASKKNIAAGVLSPLIKNSENKIWFAGGKIDWKLMKTEHITKIISSKPYETEYLTGCAMFIKKEVFKKIGLLDERFFLYYEDADFSLRAKNANFKLMVVPSTIVHHLEQSNKKNNSKLYWLVLSGLLFFDTHANFRQKIWLKPYLFLRKIKNLFERTFSSNAAAYEVSKAYSDYKKIAK